MHSILTKYMYYTTLTPNPLSPNIFGLALFVEYSRCSVNDRARSMVVVFHGLLEAITGQNNIMKCEEAAKS
jgi:hypothetical protein